MSQASWMPKALHNADWFVKPGGTWLTMIDHGWFSNLNTCIPRRKGLFVDKLKTSQQFKNDFLNGTLSLNKSQENNFFKEMIVFQQYLAFYKTLLMWYDQIGFWFFHAHLSWAVWHRSNTGLERLLQKSTILKTSFEVYTDGFREILQNPTKIQKHPIKYNR